MGRGTRAWSPIAALCGTPRRRRSRRHLKSRISTGRRSRWNRNPSACSVSPPEVTVERPTAPGDLAMLFSTWNVDASQILSRQELAAVLKDLQRGARRLSNDQMNWWHRPDAALSPLRAARLCLRDTTAAPKMTALTWQTAAGNDSRQKPALPQMRRATRAAQDQPQSVPRLRSAAPQPTDWRCEYLRMPLRRSLGCV